jgi:hypothetical protein
MGAVPRGCIEHDLCDFEVDDDRLPWVVVGTLTYAQAPTYRNPCGAPGYDRFEVLGGTAELVAFEFEPVDEGGDPLPDAVVDSYEQTIRSAIERAFSKGDF